MKKLKLVYDYQTPHSFFPNGYNYGFLNEYIQNEFDLSKVSFENINKKYQDAISVYDADGLLCEIADKISVFDVELYNDSIFLYTICPFGGASAAYGFDYTVNEGQSFFHFIPETTKKLIREHKDFYLFINYSNEGTLDYQWFEVIYRELKKFKIPPKKLIFCISDYNIKQNFENWFSQNNHNEKIKLVYTIWSLQSKAEEFRKILNKEKTTFINFSNECSVVSSDDITFLERPYKFLMFNRRLRPHRIYTILFMYYKNILNDSLISYDFNKMECFDVFSGFDEYHFIDEKINEEYKVMLDTYNDIKKTAPIKHIDYTDLENVWGFNFEKKEPYLNSYIHIIGETNFFETGGYFSEKTWKPIGHLQPFIFMGSYGGLKELKKLGFKTFHPFIDESYDGIENNEERFSAIMYEIHRLSSLSKKDLNNWYKEIYEEVLLYNQKHFLNQQTSKLISKTLKNDILEVINDKT